MSSSSHMYTFNQPPAQIQLGPLYAQLAEQQREETGLLSEIEHLQARLEACRATQTETRVLLSRHRWIPQEMLSAIFEAFCEGEYWSHAARPFILAGVCRRWREIVLSTSSLWTNLHVRLHVMSESKLSFLHVLLKRSNERPLDIAIDSIEVYSGEATLAPVHRKTLEILRSRSHRWRKLDILGVEHFQLLAIMHGNLHLPILEEVKLSMCGTFYLDNRSTPWEHLQILQAAPVMRRLTLDAVQFWDYALYPPSTLTELSIVPAHDGEFTERACWEILRRCPKLQKCTLALKDESEGALPAFTSWGAPILLADLHTLRLSAGYQMEDLLIMLVLPSLCDLTISALPDSALAIANEDEVPDEVLPCWWVHHKFVGLLSRSRCTLKRFALIRVRVDERELVGLLRLMPELEELVIDELDSARCIGQSLLEHLTPQDNGACLVPRLRVIRLRIHWGVLDTEMLNMVMRRCNAAVVQADGTAGAHRGLQVVDFTPADRQSNHDEHYSAARSIAERDGLEVLGVEALYPRHVHRTP